MPNKTILDLAKLKTHQQKIVMLTAYDALFATLFDRSGVDVLLVGDSLAMVIQGHANTIPVTLDHIIYHSSLVSRAAQQAHVVADLPFGTYKTSIQQAVDSAFQVIQKGGAHSVKLEGGAEMAPTVAQLVSLGIPVMGHVGLTPQSVHQLGGFHRQGKTPEQITKIEDDAFALQKAGCYALVVECIPADTAEFLSNELSIPVIGIGSGDKCNGQVLVGADLLGLTLNPPPFVKAYDNLADRVKLAAQLFCKNVRGL